MTQKPLKAYASLHPYLSLSSKASIFPPKLSLFWISIFLLSLNTSQVVFCSRHSVYPVALITFEAVTDGATNVVGVQSCIVWLEPLTPRLI